MKKLQCCLTAIAALCAALLRVGAAGGSLTLSAGRNGKNVIVTVSAKNLYITSAQLLVRFNGEKLSFNEGVSLTGQQDEEADVRLLPGSDNTVQINYASMQTVSGELIRLSFTVKDNAEGTVVFVPEIRTLYVSQTASGAFTQNTSVPFSGDSVSLGGSGRPEAVYSLGDVDLDGAVSPADARLALRASVRLETLAPIPMILADTDGDGAVTPADARRILRASVNLETL